MNPYELARALLDNAEQLVADAELLLEHGRHPRAAALSLMALEEMSKIQFCVESIVEDTPVPAARSKEWTNHRDKFTGAKALELAFVEESPHFDRARIRTSVLEDQGTKLASLYVDHTDGRIATPATTKVDAPRLVERARVTVDWLARIVFHLTPEAMEEIRPYREVIEQFLSAAINENDMEGSVERLRRSWRPGSRSRLLRPTHRAGRGLSDGMTPDPPATLQGPTGGMSGCWVTWSTMSSRPWVSTGPARSSPLGVRRPRRDGHHQSRYSWVCDRCGATGQPEQQDHHDAWYRQLTDG